MGLGVFALAVMFLAGPSALAQGRNWYFGNNAGLSFTPSWTVTPVAGALVTGEGCSAVDDPSGNLLFYTDGRNVYQKNHLVMPNGSGLTGDPSATQSGMIVPRPGTTEYYVFTVDNAEDSLANGLRYSVVDMALNSGLGDVTALKNFRLNTPTIMSEKLTGINDGTCGGFWLIAHGYALGEPCPTPSVNCPEYVFYAHHVTSAGVNLIPVTSVVGLPHAGNLGIGNNWPLASQGQMKISPDGTKLALGFGPSGGPNVSRPSQVEVFNFSTSSGVVSGLPITLDSPCGQAYGVEFSPNSRFLYVSTVFSTTQSPSSIRNSCLYQFDLSLGTQSAIDASRQQISPPSTSQMIAQLQLGPDGKIYAARSQVNPSLSLPSLGVINSPNGNGSGAGGCDFVLNGVSLQSGTSSRSGLPNFVQGKYYCGCLCLTNQSVECIATNNTYKWEFCVTNCWDKEIAYLSFLDLPAGVTVSQPLMQLPSLLQPGQGLCITNYITNPTGSSDLCFIVGAHTTNLDLCCSVTNCITLPPCCVALTNETLTAIQGTGCFNYSFDVVNVSGIPMSYLFLVQDPPPPPTCVTFNPNVVYFNPPLASGASMTKSVTVCFPTGCVGPVGFLASAHNSNLVECCSSRRILPRPRGPIGFADGFAGSVFVAGSSIRVPVVIDGSIVGTRRAIGYDGTNVVATIPPPDISDGQHDDWFIISNAVAGAHVITAKLVDVRDGEWFAEPATVYVVETEAASPAAAPRLPAAALVGGNVSFSLATEPGVACRIEYTESLAAPDWKLLRSIVGDGSVMKVNDALTNAPQRFYRVRMQ